MADISDIVLIYLEEAPVSFARIEDIVPDHKQDWYQIHLLMLQIPLQMVTWILREEYINGEPFSMNGKKMRLERVEAPAHTVEEESLHQAPNKETLPTDSDTSESHTSEPDTSLDKKKGKIISFSELKNHRNGQDSDT